MIRRLIAILLVLVCCALSASRAMAWGTLAHSFLTMNTVMQLPAGALKNFINQYFPTVSNYATNEPPGQHYINIDVYPEFLAGRMPRDLNVLYAKYGTAYVNSQGISPWTIANYRATLTAQMIAAKTTSDFAVLARTAGEMAHYIEDINQPLHTADNYDGQFTGNSGIHARYESNMTQLHFADLTIVAAPQNCVYISDTVDWILHSIEDRTWGYVDDILAADTLAKTFGAAGSTAYFNSLWNSTGTFTHSQFQFATEMIASAWYSAWIDAGSPSLTPVPEPSGLVLLCLGSLFLLGLAYTRR